MAANLPTDIITDILSRLSVRDLLRYRSVAKPWCSLIDGPEFIKKHLDRAVKTASGLGVVINDNDLYWMSLKYPETTEKLEKPFEDDGGGTKLLGSCNGLLVVLNSAEAVTIWNPSTRRYREIPKYEIECTHGKVYLFLFSTYGFGYYKLVRLVQFLGDGYDSFDSEVTVYSAKNDSWKRIHDFPYRLSYKHGHGILVGNALNWAVSRSMKLGDTMFIAAFDLEKEEYFEVPMPSFEHHGVEFSVDVLGGFLFLVFYFNNDCPIGDLNDSKWKRVEVWVMKEYGVKESWAKVVSVVTMEEIIEPIAYLSDNQILLNKDGNKFITYDLKEQKVEDADMYWNSQFIEFSVCVESLVGLDDTEGQNGWKLHVERKKKKKNENEKKKSDDFLSQGFKLVL